MANFKAESHEGPVDALHYVHNAWCHPQPYTTQHAPLQFRQLTLSHIPDRTATPNSLVRIPESARVEPGQNLRATFTPAFSWPILQPWLRTTLKVPSDAAQAQLSSSPPSIRKVHTPLIFRRTSTSSSHLAVKLPVQLLTPVERTRTLSMLSATSSSAAL
ncbi:hypothetical protein BJV77DRAFT_1073954 [Russula vinacea]|nr:hypothetical protein BJV77DRAFT_1073954 [Russula vinacea]